MINSIFCHLIFLRTPEKFHMWVFWFTELNKCFHHPIPDEVGWYFDIYLILHLINLNFLSYKIIHCFNYFSSSRTFINLGIIQWTSKAFIMSFKLSNSNVTTSEESFRNLDDLIILKISFSSGTLWKENYFYSLRKSEQFHSF